MKPRKTLSVYVLFIGVMGMLIVGGIISFQIFSAITKNQLTTIQKEVIKPIDGSINKDVIDNLTKRKPFTQEMLKAPAITPAPTPTIASSSAEATVSATPTP